MYRTKEDVAPSEPRLLAYTPLRRGQDNTVHASYRFVAPLLVGIALGAAGLADFAIPVMIATGIGFHVAVKRLRNRPAATLRIDSGTLRVLGPDAKERLVVALDDLLDVTLDSKSIETLQEASGPLPELRFIDATVGPAIDVARVTLVTRDDSLHLTDEHVAHSDSLEWKGKIRQFLRKSGWVPKTEREPRPTAGPAGRRSRPGARESGS